MYYVLTLDPLYASKDFFDSADAASAHIKKVIDVSLDFFKSMRADERQKYNVKRFEKMHELVKCVYFEDHLRDLFGSRVEMQKPLTNEAYAILCNKKNKAKSVGKDFEERF
jgi:hypothetical protein